MAIRRAFDEDSAADIRWEQHQDRLAEERDMHEDEIEMWYVEYTDAQGLDVLYPAERGYVARRAAEEFIESLPYEQQMSAEVQHYNPFSG